MVFDQRAVVDSILAVIDKPAEEQYGHTPAAFIIFELVNNGQPVPATEILDRYTQRMSPLEAPFSWVFIPSQTLGLLLAHADLSTIDLVAGSTFLNEHGSVNMHAAVASNVACPTDLLERYATHEETAVRLAVADNSSTPVDVLVSFANDPIVAVRAYMASNPNTPPWMLDRLAQSPEKEEYWAADPYAGPVHQHVASNPNTPVSALEHLVFTGNLMLCRLVSQNTSAPKRLRTIATLTALANGAS